MSPKSLGQRPGPCGRVLFPAFVFVFFCAISPFTSAQLIHGQFFTSGMAISDSPAPASQVNAGSNLNIAIDLSGDGKLSQDAFLPTSTLPTAYQSLNIYLVSADSNLNLTVSEGPQFLQQEPGSTVKHLDWSIPACVSKGNYNLTLYELSRINQVSYYSITPIPIVVKSQSASPCSGVPAADPQPQLSSPPPRQPWLSSGNPVATSLANPISHPSTSGAIPTTSIFPSSGTVTITLSPSPTTATFVSTFIVPTTVSGIATTFTTETTYESVSTVLGSSGGAFIPINTAIAVSFQALPATFIGFIGACIVAAVHM